MNFMFITLNNIEIPAEKYDILPTGIIPNVEMYVISPECTFTYNGKNATSIIDASPIQEDLGKYDWHAMMRKPMIAVWTETDEIEMQFQSKEEADAYYTPKELFYSDILPEKISLYCAILECLFAIEKNHRKNISEMTAKFVAANSQEKTMIEQDMKDAYSVRSDFVHGDVNTLFDRNEQLVMLSERLDDYVRRAARKAFADENCKYENTKEDKKRVRQYFELLLQTTACH